MEVCWLSVLKLNFDIYQEMKENRHLYFQIVVHIRLNAYLCIVNQTKG